ncbi:MAG: ABC transporter substrate-binding protein [Candidatus Aminicenantes bacterium]|nr:ABC transporter substrate-binding protein [Candidatus Aminicenantes bacterium]
MYRFLCVLLSAGLLISLSLIAEPSFAIIQSPREYERIICAAPSVTEMVFSLGLGDRVVGVSHFTVYPPAAQDKKSIGGLINPSKERIIALNPDLVLTQGKHERLAELCRTQNIKFVSVKIEEIKDIHKAILELGILLNAQKKAQRLSQKIKKDLSALTAKIQNIPPKKVFLCLSHTPGDLTGLMTTGQGTFLHEIIEMSGGINIFSDIKERYPRVSKESLIMRHPDIIIEVYAKGLNLNQQEMLLKDWDRLSILPAVGNSRIHFLTEDYLLIPGVRVNLILKKFIQTLHPEVELEND